MKKSLIILVIILAYWMSGPFLTDICSQHEGHADQGQKEGIYYCPMHPTYTSDKPGDCPICNMKLVKKEQPKEEKPGVAAKEGFFVSMEKQQLIGVKTDKVTLRPLAKTIETVGRVAFDPELYKGQQEYIEAQKFLGSLSSSTEEPVVKRAKALVEASELKLKLLGLNAQQIEELKKSESGDRSLLISDSSTWIYATIYEYELYWIKIGQEAEIRALGLGDKTFKGAILAIDPVFDPNTRSVRARIKTQNNNLLLKPDMFVDVTIFSELGLRLAVPKEAILDSGEAKNVFISLGQGRFKPVEVKTGVSSDDYIEVVEGLKENDLVITSGNFLIDSESKLKAALDGATHQHAQ